MVVLPLLLAAAGGPDWQRGAPLPLPRAEVAAAVLSGRVVVAGGFLEGGESSARVDLYAPAEDRWGTLPPLPIPVNHAMAAASGGRLYVLGGYSQQRRLRDAYVLRAGRWQRLPALPEPRAAGGAAVVEGKLYVVGGVGSTGLARTTLVLDLARERWSTAPAPTPREHLGVVARRGRVYAVAGRNAGFDTNLRTFEVYDPRTRRWTRLPPVPDARGGTGAAAVGDLIVSAGGESAAGTNRAIYAFDVRTRRWRRLADLPTPRHGLAVAGVLGRVYAIGGGPTPGLSASDANEYLELGRR